MPSVPTARPPDLVRQRRAEIKRQNDAAAAWVKEDPGPRTAGSATRHMDGGVPPKLLWPLANTSTINDRLRPVKAKSEKAIETGCG